MIGELPLGAHFHNTRGCGLASAFAAVQAGVTRLDAVGRRAGRLPVRAGCQPATSRPRIWCTCCATATSTVDVDLDAAIAAARVAQQSVGHELPSALLRAGDRLLS